MNGRIIGRPETPWHLWMISGLGVLWNFGGMFSWYSVILGDPASMGFTAEMVAYFDAYPVWVLVTYTMGTWGAFFGSVALLARRAIAPVLFVIAILGLFGTTAYERAFSALPEAFQGTGQLIFTIVIWSTTVGLFLYARWMASRGILRPLRGN